MLEAGPRTLFLGLLQIILVGTRGQTVGKMVGHIATSIGSTRCRPASCAPLSFVSCP